MTTKILTELSAIPQNLVIPLFQSNLESNLKSIARSYSLDADLLTSDFSAGKKEILITYSKKKGQAFRVFLVGLGSADNVEGSKSIRGLVQKNKKLIKGEVTVDLTKIPSKKLSTVTQWLIEGAIIGRYDLGLYKTEEKEENDFSLSVFVKKDTISEDVQRSTSLAETKVRIMDLVNSPANKLTPKLLGNWAIQSGEKYGYSVNVLGKDEITDLGLNALLAVNQGSDLPPRFIIAEYNHKDAKQTIGIVGKGVTFDTGGISIKGSANMHYMKSDMGGAAAALGSIEAVARLNLPVNLIVVVPATENNVGGKAVKPGDIIHSYAGKTIEVIDTDAEGRLILADALSYITKNYSPDVLIDFATLTGSVIATLGYHAAGVFTNDKKLSDNLQNSGAKCGERLWPLPLWSDYEEDLESDVADVKNYSGKPLAGAITAAKFLEVFVNDHKSWAHIDIAGTAFGDTEFGKQKNATGYGVGLVVSFLEECAL